MGALVEDERERVGLREQEKNLEQELALAGDWTTQSIVQASQCQH